MNIETFLAHYSLEQNPFGAEEARHDPVFDRLVDAAPNHPDFAKILGRLDRPSTAVVFGEKGSGKTAIRLRLGRQVAEHNHEHPDERVLIVPYDDFNPVLDNLLRTRKQDAEAVLEHIRLEDHQDAILSLAVTRLADALLGESAGDQEPVELPEEVDRTIRQMPRQTRVDLAVLAAMYDQPRTGSLEGRWSRLRSRLRLGWRVPLVLMRHLATGLLLLAIGFGVAVWAVENAPIWLLVTLGVLIAGAAASWGYWLWRKARLWSRARQVRRDMPAINRSGGDLQHMLGDLSEKDLARQPLPIAGSEGASDARYQLTRHLLEVLGRFGYTGIMVLVDRVDEPTLVSGDPEKMRAIVWPMFDNKFLQQRGVGVKLLLPIELRHMLHRESAQFFQEARLDKQNMIDRLTWSGTTLYDLCTMRLQACQSEDAEAVSLTDLFAEDVSREMLIDGLDQMHQPRDAFKFLYQTIQEHCRLVPEEEQNFKIARLTLETVRKQQSQRVQELYRGLTPA